MGETAKGTFGYIYLACPVLAETEVALNVLEKSRHWHLLIMTELEILKTLEHPNMV